MGNLIVDTSVASFISLSDSETSDLRRSLFINFIRRSAIDESYPPLMGSSPRLDVECGGLTTLWLFKTAPLFDCAKLTLTGVIRTSARNKLEPKRRPETAIVFAAFGFRSLMALSNLPGGIVATTD